MIIMIQVCNFRKLLIQCKKVWMKVDAQLKARAEKRETNAVDGVAKDL